jgi:hypothetical protein
MMLKLGRIAVVSTAALKFAAATIPTKAEASAGFIPGAYGPVGYGGGGYYGGGYRGDYGGYGGYYGY